MEVVKRRLARPVGVTMDSRSPAFAEAVVAELRPDDWAELSHRWSATKQDQIRQADPNTLAAHFPAELISGPETVVGFSHGFPRTPAFRFKWTRQAGGPWTTTA
ncbi:MAG: hypothetical protein HYY24_05130 [Verrucomicrobia bacterium]|nr:hypothetical protein [Verrucomicrobiota bacterium]